MNQDPEAQCRIHQGSPIIHILSLIHLFVNISRKILVWARRTSDIFLSTLLSLLLLFLQAITTNGGGHRMNHGITILPLLSANGLIGWRMSGQRSGQLLFLLYRKLSLKQDEAQVDQQHAYVTGEREYYHILPLLSANGLIGMRMSVQRSGQLIFLQYRKLCLKLDEAQVDQQHTYVTGEQEYYHIISFPERI